VAVYAIQQRCPRAAQWREEDYLLLSLDPGGTILVAELASGLPPEIAGFAVFYRVRDEAELRNIAVHPVHQRKGIARALLAAGIRSLEGAGARRIFLEVRASNQTAIALYLTAGFNRLYARRDYYRDPVEDALVMACGVTAVSPSTAQSISHLRS